MSQPDLMELEFDFGPDWIAMANGEALLVANFSDNAVEVPYGGELLYSFTSPEVQETSTMLDPHGFAILGR